MAVATIGIQARHHRRLLILPNSFLKEVGLPLQTDQLHPIKRILHIVHLPIPQRIQQSIRHKLDVLTHQVSIHPHQRTRQSIADELPLDSHSIRYNPSHFLLAQLHLQQAVQQTSEIAVQTLISRDQLIRKRQSRHEAALLQPEYRAEAAGKENPLHTRKRDQPFSKGLRAVDPAERPIGLLLDAGDGLNRAEEVALLVGVLDVGLEQERVHLRMDVLDGDLEAVEGARLGDLDLLHEAAGEILQNDAVGGGEEG